MKTKTTLVFGALAALSPFASAQTVIDISGATAFRAAAHDAIVAVLGGQGTTQYGYVGSSLGGASRAIFKGSIGGQPYIVRTNFSGSLAGIADVATTNSIAGFITTDTAVTTAGGALASPSTESSVPRWAFSDVDKALSNHPNSTLGGGPVGIVPFMFVAGRGAPAGITNVTDQIHEALWVRGNLSASFFTGAPSDTTVLATGRNSSSGTRATILSETGYGAFRPIVQWNANTSTGELSLFANEGNEGHTGNAAVAAVLGIDRSILTLGGGPVDAVFVGYLTISDAVAITGYDEATGSYPGNQAIPLTYNGVRYSVENVRNGSYTLWGYQQLYTAPNLNPAETSFDTALRNAIPNTLTAATGIANDADMKVTREGGDGGPVYPKD